MNVNIKKSAAELSLDALLGDASEGATGARAEALARLSERGIPHRRQEPWVYTDLRNLMRNTYRPAEDVTSGTPALELIHPAIAELDACRIVRVNGRINEERSDFADLPDGVSVSRSPEIDVAGEGYIPELIRSFAPELVTISIDEDAVIEKPILLVYVTRTEDPVATYSATKIIAGAGSSTTIIECFCGEGDYQSNGLLDVRIGDGATVKQFRHQDDDDAALHLSRTVVNLEKEATWRGFTLTEGGRVSRAEATITFNAPGSSAHTCGAKLLHGDHHADSTIIADHAVPDCESLEVFKSLLDGNARGIFQGKVIVRPGASGTDGQQHSDALVLSDTAEMNTKPELEIYNDDVECAHGATVGEIDENLMFYLRTRGIPKERAEALLMQAFVGEALEMIPDEELRDIAIQITERWLVRRMGE